MYMETKKEQKNETKEKRPLTGRQRQATAKDAGLSADGADLSGLYVAHLLPLADREKARQGQGFNTDMPLPEDAGIIGDKAKAYEQQQLEKRQKQRRGMVGDLSSFWDDTDVKPDTTAAPDDCRLTPVATPRKETESRQHAGIRSSATANKRLNTSLGTFYEPPKEDDEKKRTAETYQRAGAHGHGAGEKALGNGGTGRPAGEVLRAGCEIPERRKQCRASRAARRNGNARRS